MKTYLIPAIFLLILCIGLGTISCYEQPASNQSQSSPAHSDSTKYQIRYYTAAGVQFWEAKSIQYHPDGSIDFIDINTGTPHALIGGAIDIATEK